MGQAVIRQFKLVRGASLQGRPNVVQKKGPVRSPRQTAAWIKGQMAQQQAFGDFYLIGPHAPKLAQLCTTYLGDQGRAWTRVERFL